MLPLFLFCIIIAQCSFIGIGLMTTDVKLLFMHNVCMSSVGEMPGHVFSPFSNWRLRFLVLGVFLAVEF